MDKQHITLFFPAYDGFRFEENHNAYHSDLYLYDTTWTGWANWNSTPGHDNWVPDNEYGINYYYPVLPKINRYLVSDESLGLQGTTSTSEIVDDSGGTSITFTDQYIPYGTPRNWNEDDIYAYVTNSDIGDDSLLIDIENEEGERNIFNDTSGGDIVGIGISDYKLRFDSETLKPNKNKFISKIGLGRTRDGAF